LSEKDLSKLSQLIGNNWKHLGRQLGLTGVHISQVDIDTRSHSTQDKIHEMFVKWAKIYPEENTLATVISAVNESCKTEIEKTEFVKFIDEKRSAKKRQ
jgi:acyl-[acyl carrier protein]--UDP-N-acetylglucosamine O-acyltransferase